MDKINKLTYASLMSLALGLYTSITFSALSHIFMIIPLIFFLPKINFKLWNKSQWFLLLIIVTVIMSILLNQDIAVNGYKPLSKSKYYLFGLFSIMPIQSWFNSLSESDREKKIRYLVNALLITSTVASLYGMGRIFWGINLLQLSFSDATRNTGFFGMVLNFAHNLAFIQLLATYFLFYRKKTQKIVGNKLLIFVWIVNLISLYTTYSRGAFLAFLIAVPFIFFKSDLKKFFSITIVATFVIIIVSTIPALKVIRIGSDLERVAQWKTAWVAFKEKPVIGVGYLNFERMCPDLKIKYNIGQQQQCGHAHNIFLEMLASTGLIGFLSLTLWLGFWLYEMIKRDDMLAEVMIPLIVVFIVGGMTQATFTLGANLFLIMGLYSISMVRNVRKNENGKQAASNL